MKTRFKKNAKIFDIAITAVAGVVSVCTMLYAVWHFGLYESWPELVLNLFYIACLIMIHTGRNATQHKAWYTPILRPPQQ